ncbi:uncharacterized protein YALI1_C02160g [Yarrowia lipolytica]|uniref:Uncharacterized protein n=1 Tax=Yarrowia lipolytica TaxID=4952 RepID=A0A1D8N9A2_YARLL|nr:hypothetical protein YALI1_C02160g [Yarrowia lipolytica]
MLFMISMIGSSVQWYHEFGIESSSKSSQRVLTGAGLVWFGKFNHSCVQFQIFLLARSRITMKIKIIRLGRQRFIIDIKASGWMSDFQLFSGTHVSCCMVRSKKRFLPNS